MIKLGLRIAAITLILDQISKWVLLYVVDLRNEGLIEVTPFFNLRSVWNPGVSFGMLPANDEVGRYALIGFALLVVIILVVWLFRTNSRLLGTAIGLVIGGAIGNVVDRVFHGAVYDFLDFHAYGYHFYTFNIADTAISLGVMLLIFESLFVPEPPRPEKAPQKT